MGKHLRTVFSPCGMKDQMQANHISTAMVFLSFLLMVKITNGHKTDQTRKYMFVFFKHLKTLLCLIIMYVQHQLASDETSSLLATLLLCHVKCICRNASLKIFTASQTVCVMLASSLP